MNYLFSAKDITSNYGFLLRMLNTFKIDTYENYLRCCKVNDSKTFKNLYLKPLFTLYADTNHIYIADSLV